MGRTSRLWLDGGHRPPGYVADAVAELLPGGLVALAARTPDPSATNLNDGSWIFTWRGPQRETFVHRGSHGSSTAQQRSAIATAEAVPVYTGGRLDPG